MNHVIYKTVLDRKLYWTGAEWHPDVARAITYHTIEQAYEVLSQLLLNEGYGVAAERITYE